MAKNQGVVFIPGVAFDKKGEQITKFRDILDEEAKCGCGISCCDGYLALKNSDGERVVLTGDQIEALLALLA